MKNNKINAFGMKVEERLASLFPQ